MYKVEYNTMNGEYVKSFDTLAEAVWFCQYIHTRYPDQYPTIDPPQEEHIDDKYESEANK